MNGAITEDSPRIVSKPSIKKTRIIGYNQYFFCWFRNLKSWNIVDVLLIKIAH